MNQANLCLFPEIDGVSAITEEAVDFLRSNLEGKGEIFIGFSGGKDSIVTAELMRLSGLPYRLFYSFTGIDPPEVVRFIRRNYPKCVFLRPKKTFWRDLAVHLPPSDRLRWCCHSLKKKPAMLWPHIHRAMGIRSEESTRRAKYPRINRFQKTGQVHSYPIFHWREWQLWEFIESRGIEYPKLYDEGFDRIGCIICPYHSGRGGALHAKYRERWPKYFDLWEREIAKLFKKRQAQGKTMFYNTPQEFCDAWYLDNSARWYAKKRRGRIEKMG